MEKIIKVIGTPSKAQVQAMNNEYTEFQFPKLASHPWENVFHGKKLSLEAVNLIDAMLDYLPARRIKAIDSVSHHFFDELKKIGARLPNSKNLPYLFDFQKKEFEFSRRSMIKAIPDRSLHFLCNVYLNNWQMGIRIC